MYIKYILTTDLSIHVFKNCNKFFIAENNKKLYICFVSCGSNSVVESLVANEIVAGSNPVSRSKTSDCGYRPERWLRRRSQVAKAEVCKTSIHRFESDRRLISMFPLRDQQNL